MERAELQFAPVVRKTVSPAIESVGTVQFDAEYLVGAGVHTRGVVHRVLKVEGDTIALGEPLAIVESAELGQAQAQIGALVAKREAALRNAEREARLLSEKLTNARDHELARSDLRQQEAELLAANQKVRALGGTPRAGFGMQLVLAPMAGTVVYRSVVAGQSVEGHEAAFRVANLDYLWVVLTVFERHIRAVKLGNPIEMVASGSERRSSRRS